jgi:hypothetical protein
MVLVVVGMQTVQDRPASWYAARTVGPPFPGWIRGRKRRPVEHVPLVLEELYEIARFEVAPFPRFGRWPDRG